MKNTKSKKKGNNMKNLKISLFGMLLILLIAINAYSQNDKKLTPDERAKKVATNLQPVLNLTDAQYNEVYSAHLNFFTKVKELRSSNTENDKKEQIKNSRKELKTEMSKILNEEQVTKLKAYIKEKKENRKKTDRKKPRQD
jgi:hypothetical protein